MASNLTNEDHGFWLSNVYGTWEADVRTSGGTTWPLVSEWELAVNKAWRSVITGLIVGVDYGGPGGGVGLWTKLSVDLWSHEVSFES